MVASGKILQEQLCLNRCRIQDIRTIVRIMVITAAQLHSPKPELRFCAGSNSARGMSEIRDGEDL